MAAGRETDWRLGFSGKAGCCSACGDNTVYEPHTNAVTKMGWTPREFVPYALRNSGTDGWALADYNNIRQSLRYVHPGDSALRAAIDRVSRGSDKTWDNDNLPVFQAKTNPQLACPIERS